MVAYDNIFIFPWISCSVVVRTFDQLIHYQHQYDAYIDYD